MRVTSPVQGQETARFFGDAVFKQKFKGTIGTHTLRSNLFDAASPSQVQSNMILTVFCFEVQIALD